MPEQTSENPFRPGALDPLVIEWDCDRCGKHADALLGNNEGIPPGWVEHNMDDGDPDDDALCDDCSPRTRPAGTGQEQRCEGCQDALTYGASSLCWNCLQRAECAARRLRASGRRRGGSDA